MAKGNEETELEQENEDSEAATTKKQATTYAETTATLKGKGKFVVTETPNRYCANNAYSHTFCDLEIERLSENYFAGGFIVERNVSMETFRTIGVQKT